MLMYELLRYLEGSKILKSTFGLSRVFSISKCNSFHFGQSEILSLSLSLKETLTVNIKLGPLALSLLIKKFLTLNLL